MLRLTPLLRASAFAATAFLAACNGGKGNDTETSGGGGGGASPSGGPGTQSGGSLSTGSLGAGGGAPAFECKPAAEAGSLYALAANPFDPLAPSVSMCEYRSDVMLVVNTAALCGFTPQYGPLEKLEEDYKADGLHVLGFLSNDFNQAGSDDEIEACADQYKVTFEQFALVHVKLGTEQHPVFEWLTSREGLEGDVTWNFNKWLVGRDGTLLGRWTNETEPDAPEVVAAIEAALAE